MIMKNDDFLKWIYDRLIHVHNENKNYDYMHKLKCIIDNTTVVNKNDLLHLVRKRAFNKWFEALKYIGCFAIGFFVAAIVFSMFF